MLVDVFNISLALFLVVLNGFFVAAEFALVKVTPARVAAMVRDGAMFANTAAWLHRRLDGSLSVCQLGITMASLGLGWVGEPAFARILEPAFESLGIDSEAMRHTVAFIIAFSLITAFHLVIGEQVPKIFAIKEADRTVRWCAAPLRFFYVMTYPLTVALSALTNVLLRRVGIKSGHGEAAHNEEELRAMLRHSRVEGEVTRSELELINAIFEFDDQICRKIMTPRSDLVILDLNATAGENLDVALRTKHTRYPLCDGSLDRIRGTVHIKDLLGKDRESLDLLALSRPPRYAPETLLISRLLGVFQATHQHMLFVVDERDTVVGAITLENVLEEIIGPVQDEFDLETPDVVPDGLDKYLVSGHMNLDRLNSKLGLALPSDQVDTLSGLVMDRLGRIPEVGDRLELGGCSAEVLEVKGARAIRLRLDLGAPSGGVEAKGPDDHPPS